MNETVEDPVCKMAVPATSFATEYAGIHYAFCSAQCRQRFLENPHLYVGVPGHKAPAQQGKEVIKKRSLMLAESLDEAQAEQVKNALLEMMGVKEVCIEGSTMQIQYDLMQVDTEQIADQLALVGVQLGGGWTDRLKLAFINYLEECEVGSLEVSNKDCCH
ncbi:YHS domain-containing protein [Ferrigenium sp. UT5]|uniref:YHS domain-containing protein n=1 Tax=Ferrigenium sp. UT5 TaxID=3242105 RepID=UPI0035539359